MNETELNEFARFLYDWIFQEELVIPIRINNRLKRTHAWFVHEVEEPYIEVSKHVTQQNIYIIGDILGYELTHYYLFKHDKPYDDNNIEFYALTYKNGISRTCTTTVKDGIMKYDYHKHSSKCSCGFEIESYFPVIDNNFRPTLICPKCNAELDYNFIGSEYRDYIPTFKIKMTCESYLKRKQK